MANELEILKGRHPEIAKFIENWQNKYEGRSFDLKNQIDQADFYEAMLEIARHIAHTATQVSVKSLLSVEGITTVYVNAIPST